jgi:hypothetical protein
MRPEANAQRLLAVTRSKAKMYNSMCLSKIK